MDVKIPTSHFLTSAVVPPARPLVISHQTSKAGAQIGTHVVFSVSKFSPSRQKEISTTSGLSDSLPVRLTG